MCHNEHVEWIIKIHPSDLKYGTFPTIMQLLESNFDDLPPHIHVLPPESDINPMALFKISDFGLTLFGTIGVELPVFGKPVLTGSNAHYTNHGFTIDAGSRANYLSFIRGTTFLDPLDEFQVERAQIYALDYFLKRPFHLPYLKSRKTQEKWDAMKIGEFRNALSTPGFGSQLANSLGLDFSPKKDDLRQG
jgi:hypothetical protein